MDAVPVNQIVESVSAEKRICCRNGDAVHLQVLLPLSASDRSHPGRDDGCALIQPGVIAHVLQGSQDFQILKESLSDLLRFRISGEILKG